MLQASLISPSARTLEYYSLTLTPVELNWRRARPVQNLSFSAASLSFPARLAKSVSQTNKQNSSLGPPADEFLRRQPLPKWTDHRSQSPPGALSGPTICENPLQRFSNICRHLSLSFRLGPPGGELNRTRATLQEEADRSGHQDLEPRPDFKSETADKST